MSYVSLSFHCVFSTKERQRLITPALQERLWPYLHYRAKTFQEEFLVLLKRHVIACDDRYLWD